MAQKEAERLDTGKHPLQNFIKWFKKSFKKNKMLAASLLILIISAVAGLVAAPLAGDLAGGAVGAWHGVTDGIGEGTEAGRQAGLSAKDTQVEVSTRLTEEADLEVLLVKLNMTDLYKHGEDGDKYAALINIPGDGVYSVDLRNTQVSYTEENGVGRLLLTIPEPEFQYYPNDSGLEVIAEYPKKDKLFDGKSADGYQGYLNSRDKLEEKVQEEFCGDSAMMSRARELAREQVERLARSVCGSQIAVTVRFVGEE